mgnify:CR=1 FL=1
MPWEQIQTINESEIEEKDNDWKIQIIAHGETLDGTRYYPMATLKTAVQEGLYDGAKIYINHQFNSSDMHRNVHDYAGNILPGTVKFTENGTIEALAHFHKTEALEILKDPIARKSIGLSQSVYAKFYNSKINGKDMSVIENIKKVESVDLVPTGNAKGYFLESLEEKMDLTKLTLDELKAERPDLVEALKVVETIEKELDEEVIEAEVQKRVEARLAEMDEQVAKLALETKAKETINGSELPQAAKQKVFESLTDYSDEVVSEAIQKEIDYIKSIVGETKPEEVEEELVIGLGESEPETQNNYGESFIKKLKKAGFPSDVIQKLSKIN